MSTTLDEITTDLGLNHGAKKLATEALEGNRTQFFEAATASLEKTTLATKKIELPKLSDQNQIKAWVARWHPGWRIKDIRIAGLVIEEDPSFMRFSHINKEDGYCYQRAVSQAAPTLDDEQLKKDHPEVWLAASEPDPVAVHWGNFFGFGTEILDSLPRVLLPQDQWNPSDLDIISQYIVPGAISVRLLAPRKATPEELE